MRPKTSSSSVPTDASSCAQSILNSASIKKLTLLTFAEPESPLPLLQCNAEAAFSISENDSIAQAMPSVYEPYVRS